MNANQETHTSSLRTHNSLRNIIFAFGTTIGALASAATFTETTSATEPTAAPGAVFFDNCFPNNPEMRPILQQGSKDASKTAGCVRDLQVFLKAYNSRTATANTDRTHKSVGVNGWFSGPTKQHVAELQRHYSLFDTPKGVVDQTTWQVIELAKQRLLGDFVLPPRNYQNVLVEGASTFSMAKRYLPLATVLQNQGVDISKTQIDAIGGTSTIYGKESLLKRLQKRVAKGNIPDLIVVGAFSNDLESNARNVIRTVLKINAKNPTKDDYIQAYMYMVDQYLSYADTLPTNPTVVWSTVSVNRKNYQKDEWFTEALLILQQRRIEQGKKLHIMDWASWANEHPEDFDPDKIHQKMAGLSRLGLCIAATIKKVDIDPVSSKVHSCKELSLSP